MGAPKSFRRRKAAHELAEKEPRVHPRLPPHPRLAEHVAAGVLHHFAGVFGGPYILIGQRGAQRVRSDWT